MKSDDANTPRIITREASFDALLRYPNYGADYFGMSLRSRNSESKTTAISVVSTEKQ